MTDEEIYKRRDELVPRIEALHDECRRRQPFGPVNELKALTREYDALPIPSREVGWRGVLISVTEPLAFPVGIGGLSLLTSGLYAAGGGVIGHMAWNRAWVAPVNGAISGLIIGVFWAVVIYLVYAPLFHRGKSRHLAAQHAVDAMGAPLVWIGLLNGIVIAYASFAMQADGQPIWNWWR